MFWLGLFVPVVYVPNITGWYIIDGWIVLSIFLPFFFLRRVEMGTGHWLGLVFLTYAFLSLFWVENRIQAVWDLWLLTLLAGCFMLGAQYDLRKLWLGSAFGIGVSTVVGILQLFGWHDLVFMTNPNHPTGLFVNPDMFVEAALLCSIGLITTKQYWPLIFTAPPVLGDFVGLTHSRSAMIAIFAVGFIWLWERLGWKVLPLLLLPIGAGYVLWNDPSVALRWHMWQDTYDGLTWFGRGPGSFFDLYPEFASRTDTMSTRPESTHNDYLELLFEFGIGTIPLFALILYGLGRRVAERYLWVAFCTIAFVSFPIRIPAEGLLGMAALGSLCRNWDLSWLHRLDWRSADWLQAICGGRKVVSLEPIHPSDARV